MELQNVSFAKGTMLMHASNMQHCYFSGKYEDQYGSVNKNMKIEGSIALNFSSPEKGGTNELETNIFSI